MPPFPAIPDAVAAFHRVRTELFFKNGGDVASATAEVLEQFCELHRDYLKLITGSSTIHHKRGTRASRKRK